MIDVNLKYQSVLFANCSGITLEPDSLQRLIKTFEKYKLIPTMYTEVSAGRLVNRVAMASPEENFAIQIGTMSLDISVIPTAESGISFTFDQFIDRCKDLISLFQEEYGVTMERLSLMREHLGQPLQPEQLDQVYNRLFGHLNVEGKVYEWNFRTCRRHTELILGSSTELNVNLVLSRVRGDVLVSNGVQFIDRIGFNIDINTVPGRGDSKFTSEGINQFYDAAKILTSAEFAYAEARINEGL